jgi:hypothetical protein
MTEKENRDSNVQKSGNSKLYMNNDIVTSNSFMNNSKDSLNLSNFNPNKSAIYEPSKDAYQNSKPGRMSMADLFKNTKNTANRPKLYFSNKDLAEKKDKMPKFFTAAAQAVVKKDPSRKNFFSSITDSIKEKEKERESQYSSKTLPTTLFGVNYLNTKNEDEEYSLHIRDSGMSFTIPEQPHAYKISNEKELTINSESHEIKSIKKDKRKELEKAIMEQQRSTMKQEDDKPDACKCSTDCTIF